MIDCDPAIDSAHIDHDSFLTTLSMDDRGELESGKSTVYGFLTLANVNKMV